MRRAFYVELYILNRALTGIVKSPAVEESGACLSDALPIPRMLYTAALVEQELLTIVFRGIVFLLFKALDSLESQKSTIYSIHFLGHFFCFQLFTL